MILTIERQSTENQLNFSDWDHILFTRSMEMISSERSLRHVTNILSYPYTVAGVLHENSPYNLKNRLTIEGLTSMTGILSISPRQLLISQQSVQMHSIPRPRELTA